MDFNEMKAQYFSEYPETDRDYSFLNKIAVVTFATDPRGNISGRCRFGLVFRHKDSESLIKDGETWICELQQNYNGNRQYFGRAVKKIDGSFLFDLTQDQLKTITDSIWENHRDSVENMICEQYGDIIEKKVSEICSEKEAELQKERESIQSQINEIKGINDGLESKNRELSDMLDQCDGIIESLKQDKGELESRVNDLEAEIAELESRKPEAPRIPVTQMKDSLPGQYVFKISEDALYSKALTDGNYKVRISSDRKQMLITSDPEGTARCIDGMMRLYGLNRLIGQSVDKMPFEDINGGIRIMLDAES